MAMALPTAEASVLKRCFEALQNLVAPKTSVMSADRYAEWAQLLATSPHSALKAAKVDRIPEDKLVEASFKMLELTSKEIERLEKLGRRSDARKLYRDLLSVLRKHAVPEKDLHSAARTNFTNETMERYLRQLGFVGNENKVKTLLHQIQSTLRHQLSKVKPPSIRLWWLNPLNRKWLDDTTGLTLLLATAIGAKMYLPALVSSNPETVFEISADLNGAVYQIQGNSFIGWGIYFDMPQIETALGPQFTKLRVDLAAAKKSADQQLVEQTEDKILSLLSSELHGDYDEQTYPESERTKPKHFAAPASKLLDSSGCTARGVCRHKAVILSALLNELGIGADYETGDVTNGRHAWVALKGRDLIVDPTWGVTMTREKYYQHAIVKPGSVERPEPAKMTDNEF
jgi:hypothetical protein